MQTNLEKPSQSLIRAIECLFCNKGNNVWIQTWKGCQRDVREDSYERPWEFQGCQKWASGEPGISFLVHHQMGSFPVTVAGKVWLRDWTSGQVVFKSTKLYNHAIARGRATKSSWWCMVLLQAWWIWRDDCMWHLVVHNHKVSRTVSEDDQYTQEWLILPWL